MQRTLKKIYNTVAIFIIMIIALTSILIITYAEEKDYNYTDLESKCSMYTNYTNLYDEYTDSLLSNEITEYELYIDITFNPNKEDNIGGKYDEWLFKIIPQDVILNKK